MSKLCAKLFPYKQPKCEKFPEALQREEFEREEFERAVTLVANG